MNNSEPSVKDQLTVLTSPGMLATKRWHRRACGGWHGEMYGQVKHWVARVEDVGSFDDLVRLLSGLERCSESMLIRNLPGAGQPLDRLRRHRTTTREQSCGLRSLCVDVDDLELSDLGLTVDPSSRASLEAAVRAVADHVAPASLRGARLYYQWSSSAGVKGWSKARLHLWYFLDRPVYRKSLERWALRTPHVDPALYRMVQPHYTAAPVFVDHVGRQLKDPLAAVRSGVLDGADPIAPATWVRREEWEREDAQRRARRELERRAIEERQRAAMQDAGMSAEYRAAALAHVQRMARKLEDPPATDRHGHALRYLRAAWGARLLVPSIELEDIAGEAAVKGLIKAGRSEAVARGEVARMVSELNADPDKAPPLAFDLERVDTTPQDDDAIAPAVVSVPVQREAGKAWSSPAEGWSGGMAPVSLDEGRAWLDRTMLAAVEYEDLEGGARMGIAAPAGVGKSYAAKRRALIEVTASGDQRACLAVPSHALAVEAAADLLRMAGDMDVHDGWTVALATTRRGPIRRPDGETDPATCHYHEAVAAAARLRPDGGARFCRGCELHPAQIGHLDACPFFRARRREAVADVVIKTHALLVLEGIDAATPSAGAVCEDAPRDVAPRWRAPCPEDAGEDCAPFDRVYPMPPTLAADVARSRIVRPCASHDDLTQNETCSGASALVMTPRAPRSCPPFLARAARAGRRGDTCSGRLRARCVSDQRDEQWASLVIDEDPSGSMTHSGALSLEDISRLVRAGDIVMSDEARGKLSRLLDESCSGTVFGADVLALEFAPGDIVVPGSYRDGDGVIEAALLAVPENGDADQSAAFKRVLASGVAWRTLAGLADAIDNGWGAACIKGGALLVSHSLPLYLEHSRSVLYLDATASRARTRALLGDRAQFRRLNVRWPGAARVEWVKTDPGARSRLHTPGARRVPLIWAAAMMGAPVGSLIVTSKRNRDPELWTGRLLAALEGDGVHVIHHKGAEGRGVNRYEAAPCVIVDPWHVPGHAIEHAAYAWSRLAGDDWTREDVRARWRVEARAQLEGAEIIQEIARVRPLSATEDAPKRVIILDKRDPASLGLPVSEVLDPDRLAWSILGASTGYQTAPSILRSALDSMGGVLAPTIEGRLPVKRSMPSGLTAISVARQSYIPDELREYLSRDRYSLNISDLLNNWTGNHGGWRELSSLARVSLTWIETDAPGGAVPVLHTRRLYRQDVEHWLRLDSNATRYRVRGHERWREIEGIPQPLRASLCHVIPGGAVAIEAIAAGMGVGRRTVERHIDRLAVEGETRDETLSRLWREVYTSIARRLDAVPPEARGDALRELEARLQSLTDGLPLSYRVEHPPPLAVAS